MLEENDIPQDNLSFMSGIFLSLAIPISTALYLSNIDTPLSQKDIVTTPIISDYRKSELHQN